MVFRGWIETDFSIGGFILRKYTVLIVLVATFAAIFAAAYTFYDKYGGQLAVSPPAPVSPASEQPAVEDSVPETGTSDSTSSPENDANNAANDTGDEAIGENESEGTDGDSTVPVDANDTESRDTEASDEYRIIVPDFTLKDLDGNDVSLSDYSGKIVVLNFWATWCIYCAEEIQDLNILDRELRDAGDAVVLAVNADEPYNTVSRFVTENGIDLEVLLDEDGSVSAGLYGVVSFPNTYIINDDGSLYAYIPGRAGIDLMCKVVDMARNNEPLR